MEFERPTSKIDGILLVGEPTEASHSSPGHCEVRVAGGRRCPPRGQQERQIGTEIGVWTEVGEKSGTLDIGLRGGTGTAVLSWCELIHERQGRFVVVGIACVTTSAIGTEFKELDMEVRDDEADA